MTLTQFAENARLLRRLSGEVCIRARVGHASALLLDFGILYPLNHRGYQQPEKALTVECCWRLETRTEVIVGWGDQDETIEARLQVLVGKRVLKTRVYQPSYMASIQFAEDLRLWIFPDDSRDYAAQSEYNVCWYVTGRAIPEASK